MTFLAYSLIAIGVCIVCVTLNTIIYKYGFFKWDPHKGDIVSVHTMNTMFLFGACVWPVMLLVLAIILIMCGLLQSYKRFFKSITGEY